MAYFIKTGFWEKAVKSVKGWLNLNTVIEDVVDNIPNKVYSQTTISSLTPSKSYEYYDISSLGSALDIANPTGAFANFDAFIIRVTDNGTARALTYGNKYRALDEELPETTEIGKTLYFGVVYDATTDKFDIKATQEF